MPVFLGFSLLLALVLRMRAPFRSATVVDQLHHLCVSACPRTAHAKYFSAIVCGETLSNDGSAAFFKSAFIKMGLIHFVIVSGFQLIWLERLLAKIEIKKINLRVRSTVTFFLLSFFTLMTGAAPPVLRCLIHWLLKNISAREGWNWSRAQILSVAGFLTAAFCRDKWDLSSLFLGWTAALAFGFFERRRVNGFFEKFKATVKTNAAVYVALIPPLLPLGLPSLWSILCNAIFAPVMSTVLFPASLAGFCWGAFAAIADQIWTMTLWVVGHIASYLPVNWERFDISTTLLIAYLFSLTAWLILSKERQKGAALAIAVSFIAFFSPHAEAADRPSDEHFEELIVWNIGQGSWATIVQPHLCQHFDMGGERAPFRKISETCAEKKNEVFYSHWDWDHIGLTSEALRYLPNLCVEFAPGGPSPNRGKERLIETLPHCEDPPVAREIFLSARPSIKLRTPNDFSQVFVEDKVVFPGDSPTREEKIWSRAPALREVKILIAGHHGSKTSTSSELLSHLPQVKMIVASARKERYGHPHAEMLARAQRALLPVIITEDWGTLHFELGPRFSAAKRCDGCRVR